MANKKKTNVVKKEEATKKEVTKEAAVKEQYTRIALLLIICLLLGIILIVVIKGNETELKNGKEVVAKVKGKKFVSETLYEKMKKKYGTNVLINMVDDYIISKEVKNNDEAKKIAKSQLDSLKQQYKQQNQDFETVLASYGYDSEEALLNEMITEANKEIVAKKYIKKSITDKEIQKYYDEEVYGDYTVKHILIKPDTNDNASEEEQTKAEKKALDKAKEVIEKLDNGEKWNTLVKKYSDDEGSKEENGLVENFTKGDVVDEFFEATLKLNDKEYTKAPVKSQYGYHIILKVSSTKKPSLKESKDDILDKLVKEKLSNDTNLISKTWVDIRKDYNLEIKDTKIKKTYKNTIKEAK